MKIIKFKYEIELIDLFCEYLNSKGIEYKRELNPGFPYHKAKIDVVIRDNNDLIGIEAKIKDVEAVFRQAMGKRVFTPYNCMLFPNMPSKEKVELIKQNGIGLYIYDSNSNSFKQILFPVHSDLTSDTYYYKLKRNWNLNKCGRQFNSSELPDNYERKRMFSEVWHSINVEV